MMPGEWIAWFGAGVCSGVCADPECKSSQIFQAIGLGLYALGRYGRSGT